MKPIDRPQSVAEFRMLLDGTARARSVAEPAPGSMPLPPGSAAPVPGVSSAAGEVTVVHTTPASRSGTRQTLTEPLAPPAPPALTGAQGHATAFPPTELQPQARPPRTVSSRPATTQGEQAVVPAPAPMPAPAPVPIPASAPEPAAARKRGPLMAGVAVAVVVAAGLGYVARSGGPLGGGEAPRVAGTGTGPTSTNPAASPMPAQGMSPTPANPNEAPQASPTGATPGFSTSPPPTGTAAEQHRPTTTQPRTASRPAAPKPPPKPANAQTRPPPQATAPAPAVTPRTAPPAAAQAPAPSPAAPAVPSPAPAPPPSRPNEQAATAARPAPAAAAARPKRCDELVKKVEAGTLPTLEEARFLRNECRR